MKLEATRFVMSPGGSALGLPAGEYWAVPDAELRRLQEAVEKAKADARALWAVRVLDAWQGQIGREVWSDLFGGDEGFTVAINDEFGKDREFRSGESFSAARLSAATALYPDLPESVRRELGECP